MACRVEIHACWVGWRDVPRGDRRDRGRSGNRERSLVVIARGWLVISVGTALTFAGGTARAETLDAGKSAPALFAATCVACHASAKGLAKNTSGGLVSYLREHYTGRPG